MSEAEYLYASECTVYMRFKPNGRFVEVDVISGDEKTYYELSETGKWSVENDKVTFTTNFYPTWQKEYDITTYSYKIKGNTMKVTYKFKDEMGTATLHKSTKEKSSKSKQRRNRSGTPMIIRDGWGIALSVPLLYLDIYGLCWVAPPPNVSHPFRAYI